MLALPVRNETEIRAVEYVRMSTDNQRYSVASQQAANRAFAAERNMAIVASYIDLGRSGVTVRGRPELRRLLADARRGTLMCDAILVYDVSRWGRFQDPDEAAYHEFVCRSAGYRVLYCAEPFTEGQGLIAALGKSLKRAMAGEWSRELSVKVYAAMERSTHERYWCAGHIGYGLRRAAVGNNRRAPRVLKSGQDKPRSERSIVVLGPRSEVQAVRRIFHLFVAEQRSINEIAAIMDAEGAPPPRCGRWTYDFIRRILSHERYIGRLTWGKVARKLGTPGVRTKPEQWVSIDDAFPAIIDGPTFERAHARLGKWAPRVSRERVLADLRQLLERHGRLNSPLIESTRGIPSLKTCLRRFGTLSNLYAEVGWKPTHGRGPWDPKGLVYHHRRLIVAEVMERLRDLGAHTRADRWGYRLVVNFYLTVGISVLRECTGLGPANRWRVKRFEEPCPDWNLVARLDIEAEKIIDYFLVPATLTASQRVIWLDAEGRSPVLDAYRLKDLSALDDIVERARLVEDELEGLDEQPYADIPIRGRRQGLA